MQENSTVTNPPLTATNGSPNMPAVMEGLAQVQDGLRQMVLNGAFMPQPRLLSNGLYLVLLLSVPDHALSVMEGEKEGTIAFTIDGRSVMDGWRE